MLQNTRIDEASRLLDKINIITVVPESLVSYLPVLVHSLHLTMAIQAFHNDNEHLTRSTDSSPGV